MLLIGTRAEWKDWILTAQHRRRWDRRYSDDRGYSAYHARLRTAVRRFALRVLNPVIAVTSAAAAGASPAVVGDLHLYCLG